jgi:hypothetical protein
MEALVSKVWASMGQLKLVGQVAAKKGKERKKERTGKRKLRSIDRTEEEYEELAWGHETVGHMVATSMPVSPSISRS